MAGPNSSFLDPLLSPTIQDDGTPKTRRANINYVGFTVADNPTTDSTDITVPGGGGGGQIAEPDNAALRAVSSLSNGEVAVVASPVGTWVYSSSQGAGQVDDDRTLIKPNSISTGANGRWYNVNSSPVLPTIAALRLAVSGQQPAVHVQTRTSVADGGGGIFDYDSSDTTTADNDGTIIVAGTRRYKRRFSGAMHTEWWGLIPSASVVHDGNGTDVARAATNRDQLLKAFAVAQAMGGRLIDAPVGNFPITAGPSVAKITSYSGVILRGQGKSTVFFDPTVAATVSEGAVAGATLLWAVSCTKVRIQNLRIIGSADFAAQVPVGLIRSDKKGTYWQNDCVDCGVDDVWFETIEGEVFFSDGTIMAPPVRVTANNMHTLNCVANMYNTSGAGLDCGVNGLFCENVGQSVLQIGGDRAFALNVRASRTNSVQTSADVFLVYARTFTIDDFELTGFDNRISVATMIAVGFAGGPVRGTLRGKLNSCKIATDSGNHNGMLRFFAGEQFVPSDHVKIQGVDVDLEVNDCGGSAGVGSKITAISCTGGVTAGDDMAVNVMRLKIRNGAAGNVNRAIHVHNDVMAANRIQIRPVAHDIQGVGAEPYKFEVAPWKDYSSTRRITGLTTDEKLASLIAQLTANGALVEDVGFLPTDFTSANVRAWYDAGYGIQLGTSPRLTGTSPQMTIGGDLQQPIGLFVKVTTGGVRGTAKFDWSVDNGATFVATGVFTAATVVLEQIGITLTFPTGTYVLNDTYEATVEKWFDKIGLINGPLFLNQPTPAMQCLYRIAGGPGGQPALVSDGVDCYYSITYTRPSPSYLYAVLNDEKVTATSGDTAFDGLSANRKRVYRTSDTQWTVYDGTNLNLTSVTPHSPHVLEVFWNGVPSVGLEDGVSKGAGDTGAGTDSNGLSIGAFSGSSNFFHGHWSEIIELDAGPNSIETGAMRASLLAKYGL